ncbi:MAG: LLM class flavin-dependent oxidoreductase [Chloroflexi bacterium]|nr:LLM class flavin-dependent oxidoreductase [Chloroflexota bacterium]
MKYGFVLPSGDARTAAGLAVELERAGWDGIFLWEPVWGVDAWVSLAACAMVTERIRLGTMLTPPSRMRPWKLASEAATLDNLSGGRVILSVGLGAPEVGFAEFGEVVDRKQRAELLDEALEIIDGLWQGPPFSYSGKHYTISEIRDDFVHKPAPPVQQPRIPIWVVGAWPSERSMGRVAKYDGLIPSARDASGDFRQANPDEVREMKAWLEDRRGGTPIDIVVEGETPLGDPNAAARVVAPYRDAGATWYIEAMWSAADHDAVLARARGGPPRVD